MKVTLDSKEIDLMKKAFKKILMSLILLGTSPYSCFAAPPNIKVKWMHKNPCWTLEKRTINPTGIMVHSTASPGISALEWYEKWNKSLSEGGRQVAVHAFLDDKVIAQYLPWCLRAWHCSRGPNGSGNDSYISIEMCEPPSIKYLTPSTIDTNFYNPQAQENKRYFNDALKNMVELCAYLSEWFGIDPSNIICHQEGHKKGIASNHADVLHWWPLHGVDMDVFRNLVDKKLRGEYIKYDF